MSTDQNVGVLYGNGFGPANVAVADGAPNAGAAATDSTCSLTIAGQPVVVDYCGAAPGEIIDQINFQYPPGLTVTASPMIATLTINGVTGTFQIQ